MIFYNSDKFYILLEIQRLKVLDLCPILSTNFVCPHRFPHLFCWVYHVLCRNLLLPDPSVKVLRLGSGLVLIREETFSSRTVVKVPTLSPNDTRSRRMIER